MLVVSFIWRFWDCVHFKLWPASVGLNPSPYLSLLVPCPQRGREQRKSVSQFQTTYYRKGAFRREYCRWSPEFFWSCSKGPQSPDSNPGQPAVPCELRECQKIIWSSVHKLKASNCVLAMWRCTISTAQVHTWVLCCETKTNTSIYWVLSHIMCGKSNVSLQKERHLSVLSLQPSVGQW